MNRRRYILAHARARANAAAACRDPQYEGWMVTFTEPKQSDIQREKYHAMIDDVAKHESTFDAETWKRLLVDQFKADTNNQQFDRLMTYWRRNRIEMQVSLDGQRVITLGEQTRDFPKFVSSAFIEWLYAWGADKDIEWTEPAALEEHA